MIIVMRLCLRSLLLDLSKFSTPTFNIQLCIQYEHQTASINHQQQQQQASEFRSGEKFSLSWFPFAIYKRLFLCTMNV